MTSDVPLPTDAPKAAPAIPRLVPRARRASPTRPAPTTPALPARATPSSYSFRTPTRAVLSAADLDAFRTSGTHALVVGFVFGLADAARGLKFSQVPVPKAARAEDGKAVDNDSDPVAHVLAILDAVEAVVKAHPPPESHTSRFGVPTFRDFADDVAGQAPTWTRRLLGDFDGADAAAVEIATYLARAFGDYDRIDYGSGHELNFLMWLLCLDRVGVLPGTEDSMRKLALVVVPRYLRLMRAVQMTYYLEPAGSHGVWGLDDFQFIPFLVGAAQLVGHPVIRPKSVHNQYILDDLSAEYLYLDQIAFVESTKTVTGLAWHSPMLNDISGAKSWEKIEAGMRRVFLNEVLGKLPIMQHFLFGAILAVPDGVAAPDEAQIRAADAAAAAHHPLTHDQDHEGECCGIRVPSGLAAAAEARRRQGNALRTIPFD